MNKYEAIVANIGSIGKDYPTQNAALAAIRKEIETNPRAGNTGEIVRNGEVVGAVQMRKGN